MTSSNLASAEKISKINRNCAVLGNLKDNQQLWSFGGRMCRTVAPDSVMKGGKNPLKKGIHKILTIALKLIFALGRLLTGQSDDKNLAKVERLSGQLLEELHHEVPAPSQEGFYDLLEALGRLERSVKKASSCGLSHFKQTCKEGRAELIKPKSGLREARAARIQKITEMLQSEALPLVSQRIQQMESSAFEADRAKVKDIFCKLTSKQELSPGELADMRVTMEAFQSAAYEKYGKGPVNRALAYYGMEQSKVLTGSDAAALLTGIVTNLTLSDLEEIYLTTTGLDSPPFEEVDDEQLCQLLGQLRDINYSAVMPSRKNPYKVQYAHDQSLLAVMADHEDFCPLNGQDKVRTQSLRKYSYAEFLSRHLSYALYDTAQTRFPDGIVFPVYDKQNKLCLKQAKKLVSGNGLHAASITPAIVRPGQSKVSAQIVFRGTFCNDSLFRDISPRESVKRFLFDGPGRRSFERKRDEIAQAVFAEVKEIASRQKGLKVRLEVMGHSLGGSDSQRTVEYLAYQLRDKADIPLQGINLYAFNSPNIESDIASRFIESASKVGAPFKLRYFDVHNDSIQEFGTKRLGYCGSKSVRPPTVATSIFKFNSSFADELSGLAKGLLSRAKFFFDRSLAVHTCYCLKLHKYNSSSFNNAFIQNIYSDNKKDAGLSYGKDNDRVSKKLCSQKIDDHLVTNLARMGRKVKRSALKVLKTISLGCYSSDYRIPELGWKNDAVETLASASPLPGRNE